MSTSAATALGPTAAPPVFKRPLQSDRPNTTLSAASTNTTQRLSTPALDLSNELADLPSDAFDSSQSSSISPTKSPQEAIHVSSQDVAVHTRKPNLVAPQNGLRQTTLFGGTVQKLGPTSQAKKHAWPLATQVQPPTHHKLDGEAAKTWVYPTNLGTIRDYQYNIVARGLFHNLLVALPTGLGKTFIAATVMLNWYRWTTDAQIVFVAPTRPLVAQQVDACFHIVGIPRSDTVMLTGTTSPGLRAEAWQSKRVFFMTPQTIMNDLKTGIADPKKIVLLVVDEAHRATGGYSYVELVKFLRRFNQSFRVLALTATPGSSVEAVQQVIDGLDISRVEIRTESSLDIRQYVHQRDVQVELFDFSDEQELVMDLFAKAVKPVMDKLAGQNAYWSRDPLTITAFGMNQSRQKWMAEAGKEHPCLPFYSALLEFRNPIDSGQSKAKYAKQIVEDPNFVKLTNTVKTWVSNPDYLGHPKMEYLRSVVLNHLMDAGEGNAVAGAAPSATRIMIFAQWRNSVEDIVRVLKRNEPMVRPHAFIGQAASKGAEGMDQKKQLDVLEKFKKAPTTLW
ncbi:3'-5' DNA helicase [Taxawa tesnikishii (nom. ined.)]|nr:3'-5' DNA helicase [Dothideales sp. JES 119]